jgi:hypothetical protein
MEKGMSAGNRKVWLLLLILIPTASFAVIGELNQLKMLSLTEACACYPGVSLWGYVADGLAIFLILNILLLPLWFSKTLSRLGLGLLAIVELMVYGLVFLNGASNLSTMHPPTPNGFLLISVAPVLVMLACGYLLSRLSFKRISTF